MLKICKILFLVLLLILLKSNDKEGFTDQYNNQIKNNAIEAYQNKNIFQPGVKYKTIKKSLPWVDPVSYDDMYKLSLKESLTISNLEEVLHN
jgi:hypothetical protein